MSGRKVRGEHQSMSKVIFDCTWASETNRSTDEGLLTTGLIEESIVVVGLDRPLLEEPRGPVSLWRSPDMVLETFFPPTWYFFCRAREFLGIYCFNLGNYLLTWNQTCVTRLLSPVWLAIRSRSAPSGLQSIWKWAWRMFNCSSAKVVRMRFVLFFCWAKWDLLRLKMNPSVTILSLKKL